MPKLNDELDLIKFMEENNMIDESEANYFRTHVYSLISTPRGEL